MKRQSSECSLVLNSFGSCIVMPIKNKSNICGCALKGELVGEEMGWITAISTASREVYLLVHSCEKLTLRFCNVLFHPWIIHRSTCLLKPSFTSFHLQNRITAREIQTCRCAGFMAVSRIKKSFKQQLWCSPAHFYTAYSFTPHSAGCSFQIYFFSTTIFINPNQ